MRSFVRLTFWYEMKPKTNTDPGRLIDEIVEYIRARQGAAEGEAMRPLDQDRLLRAAIRQLRRHPIPTALLGASAIWLLLADDGEGDDPGRLGRQLEEEILGQIKGGYTYTGRRLREAADRYPWAAAAALIAGGLGAALLLPARRRRVSSDDEMPFQEDPAPGDVFDFEKSDPDEEPPTR